mmetsp:Transcript_39250/g.59877  ORF Transcript_39250/g.59877 Transcript_39250/m.59877 type:complete len:187 (-) Transcript_39250:68-628(-)
MAFAGQRWLADRQQYQLEILNEGLLMVMNYHMLCFTDFVDDKMLQYWLGYSFLGLIALLVVANILIMTSKVPRAIIVKIERRNFEKAMLEKSKEPKIVTTLHEVLIDPFPDGDPETVRLSLKTTGKAVTVKKKATMKPAPSLSIVEYEGSSPKKKKGTQGSEYEPLPLRTKKTQIDPVLGPIWEGK